MFRFVLQATLLFSLLAGCKVVQEVPVGGRVVSGSGNYDCEAGEICDIEISAGADFSETFFAIPEPGFQFSGWKQESLYLCGSSQAPCTLNVPASLTGLPIDMKLAPVFELEAGNEELTVSAMLYGPITDASVSVLDGESGGVICSGTTGGPDPVENAGKVSLPRTCLEVSEFSVITVEGGRERQSLAVNAPNDQSYNVRGVLHSVVSRAQVVEEGDYHVTAISEAAFQSVSYLIETGYPTADILSQLDLASTRLLDVDMNGDGNIDHLDLSLWNQDLDRDGMRAVEGEIAALADGVRQGFAVGVEALSAVTDSIPRQATLDLGVDVLALALSDSYLLALSTDPLEPSKVLGGELSVIDVSDPADPRVVGSTPLFNVDLDSFSKLQVHGDTVLIEAGSFQQRRIVLVDVADPLNPTVISLSYYTEPGANVTRFYRAGDIAYVGLSTGFPGDERTFWLDALEINADNSLTRLKRTPLTDAVFDMVATDSGLYVVTGDYTSSASPSEARLLGFTFGSRPGDLTLVSDIALERRDRIVTDGRYLFLPDIDEFSRWMLKVYDGSDPDDLSLVATVPLEDEGLAWEQQLTIDGSRLYMGHEFGVRVYDITDPENPVVSHNATVDSAEGIAVSGSSGFVLDRGDDIVLLEIDRPVPDQNSPAMSLLGFEARYFASSPEDDVAYLSTLSGNGITVVDASDPALARVVSGPFRTVSFANGFGSSGGYVYQPGSNNIHVYDFSDPNNPITLSAPGDCSLGTGYFSRGTPVVDDNILFVQGDPLDCSGGRSSWSNLLTFDVEDPAQPGFLAEYDSGDLVFDLAKSGDRLYAANGLSGLTIVDVSDPSQPFEIGQILQRADPTSNSHSIEQVAVADARLVVAMKQGGVGFLRMSDIDAYAESGEPEPTAIQQFLPKSISQVIVDEYLVYAVALDQVYILDTRADIALVLRGTLQTGAEINQISLTKSALLIATDNQVKVFPRLDPSLPTKMRYAGLEDF